jgi:predicted small lipoprotein YifL
MKRSLFTAVIASRVLFTRRSNPKRLSGLLHLVKNTRLAMTMIFIGTLSCFLITGCGQSGKLYLPSDEVNQNHDAKN